MLFYIIAFCIVGFIIGLVVPNQAIATVLIVAISVGWFFVWGPWAIAAFVEQIVGYALGAKIRGAF